MIIILNNYIIKKIDLYDTLSLSIIQFKIFYLSCRFAKDRIAPKAIDKKAAAKTR
jgi:hypothetical protein